MFDAHVPAMSLAILLATQIVVAEWLARNVFDWSPKRPWGAAVATVALTALAVGPALLLFDALFGATVSATLRVLIFLLLNVVQTGLVLRLIHRTSLPLSFGNSLVLNLSWAAMSFLVTFCQRLGMLYGAIPLALLVMTYLVRRWQDRSLTRLMNSVPPTAPDVPVTYG